ncbi:hypothetical protein BDV96DRAFT_288587 [Lophiotrema nucula]|uniref:Uncharacterized protein n=1 Tax=Lophiotrema nucula TaxID=690887 RepID=A0A6A5YL72_9PLEO|nr:hypothetical protein BDV96DRAFT_288587 [Lophiotrema nucula]
MTPRATDYLIRQIRGRVIGLLEVAVKNVHLASLHSDCYSCYVVLLPEDRPCSRVFQRRKRSYRVFQRRPNELSAFVLGCRGRHCLLRCLNVLASRRSTNHFDSFATLSDTPLVATYLLLLSRRQSSLGICPNVLCWDLCDRLSESKRTRSMLALLVPCESPRLEKIALAVWRPRARVGQELR